MAWQLKRIYPPVTETGDVVCILRSGKTPFLLRLQGQTYEIIAEPYLQGLMNGEVIQYIKKGVLKVDSIPYAESDSLSYMCFYSMADNMALHPLLY